MKIEESLIRRFVYHYIKFWSTGDKKYLLELRPLRTEIDEQVYGLSDILSDVIKYTWFNDLKTLEICFMVCKTLEIELYDKEGIESANNN